MASKANAKRNPILVRAKLLWNSVNPKHGGKTVVVSKETGDVIRKG